MVGVCGVTTLLQSMTETVVPADEKTRHVVAKPENPDAEGSSSHLGRPLL